MVRIASRNVRLPSSPVNKITMGMIKRQGKPPRMMTKAADSRHLVSVFHWILSNLLPPQTPYETLRLQCIAQLDRFYEELVHWNSESAAKASAFARNHVVLYCELARHHINAGTFQRTGWHPYKFMPKHHLFLHLAEIEIPAAGNPRLLWCYGEEDEIGKAVTMAASCNPKFIHRSAMSRYRLWPDRHRRTKKKPPKL